MLSALKAIRQVHRRLLIHRRGLAALCVAVLIWAALTALRPPAPASATVWTAVRDLPSGTVLQDTDLQTQDIPVGLVPRAAHDLEALIGRTLASPLGSGEVATATHVMSNDHLAGYPGRSAIPLRIPDAESVGLLRPGDRVDLVASDVQQPSRGPKIVRDAIVIALPPQNSASNGVASEGRLVIFAVPTEDVLEVAAAASGAFLNIIWNR